MQRAEKLGKKYTKRHTEELQKLEEVREGVRALGSAGCHRQSIAFAVSKQKFKFK